MSGQMSRQMKRIDSEKINNLYENSLDQKDG
jgi:hypothetical protein